MAFFNKLGVTLRQNISVSSSMNAQPTMLNAIRCKSSKLFVGGLKDAFSSFGDVPEVRSSLNYSVMQYLLNTKNKMHFDPVVALNHFVAPDVAEPSTMGKAKAQERILDKRIRSRIRMSKYNLDSGRSRGSGFVSFADDEYAMDGRDLNGRAIRVSLAQEKAPRCSYGGSAGGGGGFRGGYGNGGGNDGY